MPSTDPPPDSQVFLPPAPAPLPPLSPAAKSLQTKSFALFPARRSPRAPSPFSPNASPCLTRFPPNPVPNFGRLPPPRQVKEFPTGSKWIRRLPKV